ncbi:hypothetical protein MSUIS_05070 [Mycoplasma suis KI3806]|uniref:Uncharacterized protein n=1 Tax=Mycoplasma suis (strain KI_3806) TaxID=708248 RepID=F0V1R9_MYCS3|nr:hypothetical protein [Mycoplasma suis]CBZ40600.1 hypothetical protein MSUIS_05070 [Mycoplasma suis KI3806]
MLGWTKLLLLVAPVVAVVGTGYGTEVVWKKYQKEKAKRERLEYLKKFNFDGKYDMITF